MKRPSEKSMKNATFGLIALYFKDEDNEVMSPANKVTIEEIVDAVAEFGFDAKMVAGAYFVESGISDNSRTKDRFDIALAERLGEDFAFLFVTELARLNQLSLVRRP